MMEAQKMLVIACGAIAKEVIAVLRMNGLSHVDVTCLPAELHNRPEKIAPLVREKIRALRERYPHIFVAYADCGTGGLLDKVLLEEGVERIGGAHCYEFYAGADGFAAMGEQELGTFYLTDFLLRHFDRLIIQGLGIDKNPELLPVYFGNYKKLMYLAQVPHEASEQAARSAALRLGLVCEIHTTGYGELETRLVAVTRSAKQAQEQVIQWQN